MAFRRGEHTNRTGKKNETKTEMKKKKKYETTPPPSRCINNILLDSAVLDAIHSCRRGVACIDKFYNDEMHCARLRSNTLKLPSNGLPFNEILYNPKFCVPRETSSNRSFTIPSYYILRVRTVVLLSYV